MSHTIDEMTALEIIEYYLRRALPDLGAPVWVRFTTSILPYSQGDVAAFPEPYAERLIALGAAEALER